MAASPDDFVLSLIKADRTRVVATLRHHRARLVRPPLTALEYLGDLARAGLAVTADTLRAESL